ERVDLLLCQRPVVERVPPRRREARREEAALAHPRREHPAGVTADRTALDREAHVTVGAVPDVAEPRADAAAPDEERAQARVLLFRDVPVHARGWVDGDHARLTRD